MNSDLVREEARLPAVSSSVLFEIFPFIIIFGEDMVRRRYGTLYFIEKIKDPESRPGLKVSQIRDEIVPGSVTLVAELSGLQMMKIKIYITYTRFL
jgi:hypothetical protein